MQPPRMRVALIGHSAAGSRLADGMQQAGHDVETLADLGAAGEYAAVILAVPEKSLDRMVEHMAPTVVSGQIYIHTCLSRGVQALDEVETRGAVVVAAAPVDDKTWVVSTLDELGETIGGLIVGEMGASAIALSDAERGELAAQLEYVTMLNHARTAAFDALVSRLGVEDRESLTLPQLPVDTDDVVAAFGHISDPGLRRSYVDIARRVGEVEDNEMLEMWALQEENR